MAQSENIFDQIDVSQLECHFKWFDELNNDVNRKWLPMLLNKQLHKDLINKVGGAEIENSDEIPDDDAEDPADEGQNILDSQRLSVLSWDFTLILRATFERNYPEAFKKTKELLALEEAKNLSQSQVHVDTFVFVVLAQQLNILKRWRSTAECPVDDDDIIGIWNRVKSLRQSSEESNEGKAFINAMKSNLSRDMQDMQLRVDFAQKATELNPNCVCWQQTLYSALRGFRRSTDFRQHPSQREIQCCEKSLELWRNEHKTDVSIGIAVQMTRLYNDILFNCERGSRRHREISSEVLKYARDAVRLKPKSQTMKMRLVSLLTSYHIYKGDGYSNEQAEAQKLLKECEADPSSSEICHKIGKYYNTYKNVGFDSAKALQWFEKGLEAHKGNFPCFSDMLRNEHFRRKSTSEIIDKIDDLIKVQPKPAFRCQMMFIKGFFLWDYDKEATLHLWLNAVEEAADLNVNFVSLAVQNVCYIENRNRIDALDMVQRVRFFMGRSQLANSDARSVKDLKSIVNSIIEDLKRPRPPPRPRRK